MTAAVLVGTALGIFAVRLAQADGTSHARLLGELRLANLMAVLLSATGAVYVGLAIAAREVAAAGLDVAIGLAFVAAGAVALYRNPRESLLLLSGGFLLHALIAIAHRPGLLAPELVPRWYSIACAAYDVYLAALCYWARRR
jgi:uncharacterized membrane protein HdeD (DUF308 family)